MSFRIVTCCQHLNSHEILLVACRYHRFKTCAQLVLIRRILDSIRNFVAFLVRFLQNFGQSLNAILLLQKFLLLSWRQKSGLYKILRIYLVQKLFLKLFLIFRIDNLKQRLFRSILYFLILSIKSCVEYMASDILISRRARSRIICVNPFSFCHWWNHCRILGQK